MGIRWYHILTFLAVVIGLAALSFPRDREYGIMLSRSGRPDEAKERLIPIVEKNPDDRTVVREVARTHLLDQAPSRAGEVLAGYLKNHAEDGEIREDAVAAFLQAKALNRAIELLEQSPKRKAEHERLLALYRQTGRLDDAIREIKATMDGTPADAERWRRIAQFQMWKASPDEATESMTRAASVEPTEAAWLGLLRDREWRGELALAQKAAQMLRAFPELSIESRRAIRAIEMRSRNLPGSLEAARSVTQHPDAEPQDWVDLAQLQSWSADKEAALNTLALAAERHPEHLPLLIEAANLALEMERRSEAANYLIRIARVTGQESDLRYAAEVSVTAGQRELARSWLTPLLREENAEAASLLLLAELAAADEDQPTAEAALTQALKDPSALTAPELMNAAGMLLDFGQRERVVDLLARVAASNPTDAEMQISLAESYSQLGDAENALVWLDKARGRVEPKRVAWTEAWMRITLVDREEDAAGKEKLQREAILALERALKVEENPEFRLRLAEIQVELGQYEQARKTLASMGEVPTPMRLALAEAYQQAGFPEDSKTILAKITDTDELNAEDTAFLAYLHEALEQPQQALTYYKLADEKAKGQNDEVRLGLADAYGAAGQIDKQSEIMLARARKLQTPKAWLDAADRPLWREDRENELALLQEGRGAFPEDLTLMARTMGALIATGKGEQALTLYQELQDAGAADDPDAARDIAFALLEMEQNELAAELFEQVLAKRPEDAEVVLALAYLRLEGNQRPEARALFERYLKLEPDDVGVLYTLGDMKASTGEDPMPEFLRVLALLRQPKTGDHMAMRSRILWRLGERDRAFHWMRLATRDKEADIDRLLDLTDLLLLDELPGEALALLDTITAQQGETLRIRRQRSQALIQQGRYEEASRVLQALRIETPDDPEVAADLAVATDARRRYRTATDLHKTALQLREKP